MRKLFITAVLGACLGAGLLAMPGAKANSTCTTGVAPSGTGGRGAVSTPAGCLTASGDAASQKGYVVADGVPSNPGPGGGYIGLDSSDGGPTIVGCSNGDYNENGYNNSTNPAPDANGDGQPDEAQNNVIASPNHQPTAPDPADPCTPSGP